MGLFDFLFCKYPLPNLPEPKDKHQSRFYQTKDLDSYMSTFTITEDGRLTRQIEVFGTGRLTDPEYVEHHGDIVFYGLYKINDQIDRLYYKARFSNGKLNWIKRLNGDGSDIEPQPDCCSMWPSLAKGFTWFVFENFPHLIAMPCIVQDGRKIRVNHCPSCGQPARDRIMLHEQVYEKEDGELASNETKDFANHSLREMRSTIIFQEFALEEMQKEIEKLKRIIVNHHEGGVIDTMLKTRTCPICSEREKGSE